MVISRRWQQRGFTIVELLVVIIVIAILAAIVIVAYNGVRNNAVESSLKSELRQASTKVAMSKAEHGAYPSSLSEIDLVESETFELQYTGSGHTFCMSIYSTSSQEKSFHINETSTINTGLCPGHGPPTSAACFLVNSSWARIINYYSHENNNSSNPACPRDVIIPSEINGTTVTSITGMNGKNLTSVSLPNTVTELQTNAFYNNQLQAVHLSNSLEIIGENAFYGNQLETIDLPDSVTTIGAAAFYGNQLAGELVIPNSVTSMGGAAFRGNNLSSVILSNSISSIGGNTFYLNDLTSIVIPPSVTSIGQGAFSGNQLEAVSLPSALVTIGKDAFSNNQLTEVVIPPLVTTIGDQAFRNNNLTSITVPPSVASIGYMAFRDNNLTVVSIPTATTLGSGAFDPGVTVNRY